VTGPKRLTAQQLGAIVPKERPARGVDRKGVYFKAETSYGTDTKPSPLPNLSDCLVHLWRLHYAGTVLRVNDGAQLWITNIRQISDLNLAVDAEVGVKQQHPNGSIITADVRLRALVDALDINVPGWRTL
jgi:hypothetical protein